MACWTTAGTDFYDYDANADAAHLGNTLLAFLRSLSFEYPGRKNYLDALDEIS